MTLHILTQTHTRSPSWSNCQNVLKKSDALLLSCEAVYDFEKTLKFEYQVKVLRADAEKRGLAVEEKYLIDYAEFVEMTELHQIIQTWS